MKHKTRRSLAAALTDVLFDPETRQKSNVRGRGKDQLNPTKIEYVKSKCFELHPSTGNMKEEWEKCIISIDERARSIKRQKKNKEK